MTLSQIQDRDSASSIVSDTKTLNRLHFTFNLHLIDRFKKCLLCDISSVINGVKIVAMKEVCSYNRDP